MLILLLLKYSVVSVDIVDITSEDVLAKPPRKGLLPTPNFPPALFPGNYR
jgi:hypothetical protein